MQGRRIEAFRGEQARLPAIAPRSEAPNSVSNVPPEAQRNRLPPRSRSGCWTCRTRKVKCDEQRPSCGQCLRLGHSCDYNPRLAFKDDTPRIVERMQDVSTVGSYVWDPAMSDTVPREISRGEDHLPPFPQLASDEEREQKAELRKPGTYHVVSNPSSFERLPEYCDELSSLPRITQGSTHSNIDLDNTADDQTTVILKVFEKSARKPLTQQSQTHMGSFSASVCGLEVAGLRTLAPIERYTSSDSLSLLSFAGTGVQNVELLRHYRVTISPSIFRTGVLEGYEDVFETQARTYPPLFHAIMALSALIMAQRTGVRSADALEHYQQVIPALKAMVRCSQDSYSDGALFTHFILLVYEVIAWDHQESSMWQQHSNQLLRIITLRRQANGLEPHDFVVWALCIIDIQALLSASGDGTFAEVVLKEGLLPSPEKCLAPSTPLQSHPFHLDERAYFPALIEVNQDVLSLALKVGQMARDTRAQVARASDTIPVEIHADSQFALERRLRIQNLQNLVLRSQNNWRSQYPDFWTWLSGSEALPDRMFASAKYSYLFVLLLVIYSHTSMFPGQLMDQNLSSDSHASACATEIIQVARLVLSQERFEVRCTVLPLFMAAVATKDPGEKEAVMELLRVIETYANGGSTESVRMLLQTIYEEQRVATIQKGHANSVDWINVMELSGLRVII